jgi:surfactin synthase thioesterase subunit
MAFNFFTRRPGSTEFWQPVMQQLSADHQKTVMAYPSFAGHPEHPYIDSFDDLQDYILDQIQQPCIVIAQSMGGFCSSSSTTKT